MVEESRVKQRSRTVGMRQNPRIKEVNGKEMRTRTVIFVEQTRDGALAKALREVATRLEGMIGFRVKVVERTGSSLRNSLPNTNPWAGQMKCGRTDCVPCEQESGDNIDCTKRNLVYENICTDCNPGASNKGELKAQDMKKDMPSVYVGETARSLYERGKEHWEAWRTKSTDSHILKHWTLHHGGVGKPNFVLKVVGHHRTALSRQVGEAVRIARRGHILNSKGEFNRCKITRLTLGQEDEDTTDGGGFENEKKESKDEDCSQRLLEMRDKKDKEERAGLGQAECTISQKREGEQFKKKKSKKLRYERDGGTWGEVGDEARQAFLFSGLEGVGGGTKEDSKITSWIEKTQPLLVSSSDHQPQKPHPTCHTQQPARLPGLSLEFDKFYQLHLSPTMLS